ncbi:MAG: PAS domain S-box protein, partial [Chloroflexi bacterium]|nr:PAS domain S-box protein [Chloroflexota bacterium]
MISDTFLTLLEQYTDTLESYLHGGGESALDQAYEIGRQAVEDHRGVLDISTIHQQALEDILQRWPNREGSVRRIRLASGFFVETLAAFEMVQRGYQETTNTLRRINETLEQQVIERTAALTVEIAERKQVEEKLRESEASFRLLFANNPLPMWVFDLETLYFLEVNEAAIMHYGYSHEEFLQMRITDIRPSENVSQLLEHVTSPRPNMQLTGQWRHFRKGGQIIDVQITSHTLEFAGRRAVLIVAEDITDIKQAEKERAALQIENALLYQEAQTLNVELEKRVRDRTLQLETANKELEAFSYSVSHDLRAPLRHVAGYVELLQNQAAETLDDKSRRYLQVISESATRMGTLIDSLLSFSRIGRAETHRTTVNFEPLIQEIMRDFELDTKDRHVEWQIGPLPVVYGDKSMLRLAMTNLISNALKFTMPRAQAKIEIGCTPGEDEMVFFIRDNGVGFDMMYVDKLFGVFQRLHRAPEFEGTGIGLA